MLKISAFYLVKQKSFISKKNMIQAVVNIKTKKLCLLTQFSATVLGRCRLFSCFLQHLFSKDLRGFLADFRPIFDQFLDRFILADSSNFQHIFGRFDQFLAIFFANFLGFIIEVNLICQIYNLLAKSVHFTTCVMKNNIGSLKKKIYGDYFIP